ncbi:MAG: tyrosine-type recombinase/integrase [Saprospiraceae bacterium]
MDLPTISIVLYQGDGNELADGSLPIKLRLTHNRKPRYIGLSMTARPDQWDVEKERFNKNKPDYEMLNYDLDDYMFLARGILREFREKKQPYSFEVFKHKFLRTNKNITVSEFFDLLIEEKDRAKTASFYEDTKNAIIRVARNKNLLFTDIDYNWLKKFEFYFSRNGKKGAAYFRALKAAYGEAIRRGVVDQSCYPFKTAFNFNGYSFSHLNVKKKKRKTHYKALSDAEIELFKSFSIEEYPNLSEGFDYFLFSYYCFGLNLKDIIQLTKDDIEGDVLYWDRSKTGFEGCAILTSPILRILEKYKNKSKYLFPNLIELPEGVFGKQKDQLEEEIRYNLNRRINKQLAKISKILGLEVFTFYSARETMSTRLLRKGFSLGEVSQALTHADTATTAKHYDGGVEIERMRELALAL